MIREPTATGSLPLPRKESYDVIIIGAGLSGLCSLIQLRKRLPQWRIKILEAGEGVGGTWLFNRYPGCRFDSESLSYAYSFDKDLIQEWHWKEAFSPQPETLRYIEYVAQKHDCYKDIHFNTRVESAYWNNADRSWAFVDGLGNTYTATFFVSCMGFLSASTLPAIPGIKDFAGDAFHTSRWPKHVDITCDFADKRIGVIGTGATGIQTITALSKLDNIKSLSVFQRTANWSAPLRNSEINTQLMSEHRTDYESILQTCFDTPSGFMHKADPRNTMDVTQEERLALWEKIYNSPGFAKWLGVFKDTYTSREANKLYSDFIANKIRERVNDAEIAESLIPKNHGFGTRRIPLESGYFEAYNLPHVKLIDLQKTPIAQVKTNGIETTDGSLHELDVLVYATGFDAITGAFGAIDWHAKDNRPLIGSSANEEGQRAIWVDHRASTFLGMFVPSMPNMFMVLGPHQLFGNATRNIEHAVGVIADLLQHCQDNNLTYVECTKEAADEWYDHVLECSSGALINEVDSWMTGVNTNVRGKSVRNVARYAGSAQEYRKRCRECRESGYKGLTLA